MIRFSGTLFLTILLAIPSPADAQGNRDRRDEYEKIYDATLLNRSREDYVREINSGWSKSLAPLRKSLRPDRSYIVMHVVEPSPVYDLRSAEHIRRGIKSGSMGKLAEAKNIGHVFTSWRCQVNGRAVEGTTGQTGETEKQFFQMISKGWGMTAFFSHFTDGHLQTPKLLDHEWDVSKSIHNVAVEVSDEVCANAMKFVSDYATHPNAPYRNFGPDLDPTKFEGGGCGSFGVSILKMSGMWGKHDFWPFLWRRLQVPAHLFGYGLKAPQDTHVYEVPQRRGKSRDSISVVNMIRKSWYDETRRGPALNQQDPEMHLLFFKTLYRLNLKALNNEFTARPEYALRGLKVNGEWQEIYSGFDVQAAGMVATTKAWWKDLQGSGYRARMGRTGKGEKIFPAMILDRP